MNQQAPFSPGIVDSLLKMPTGHGKVTGTPAFKLATLRISRFAGNGYMGIGNKQSPEGVGSSYTDDDFAQFHS